MRDKLNQLIQNAYAPYSNYNVAAIVVMKDGKEFSGVNVENASYGATICAERNAINNAIANGYKKNDFKELHIMNATNKIGYPCFLCRQTMVELFDNDVITHLYDQEKEITATMNDLITHPFDSSSLN